MLLNAPPLAESWFNHSNTVRWKITLDGRLREIVIIRIGYLNRCAYVVNQHVPELAAPEGLTKEECDALADWRASTFFNVRERAALAYADAVTRDIDVPDAVFAELQQALQRAPDRRIDRADRHLQHAHARRPGAADRSRAASPLSPRLPCRRATSLSSKTIRSCACSRSCSTRRRSNAMPPSPISSRMRSPTSTTTARAYAPRRAALSRPGCGWSRPRTRLRDALAEARGVVGGGAQLRARRARRRAALKFVQKYGLGLGTIDTAACAERGVAGADHPPPRQHRLRRARDRADAHAGAQARSRGRARHRREAGRTRLSLQAVRPAPHAQFELGAHRGHSHVARRDARH